MSISNINNIKTYLGLVTTDSDFDALINNCMLAVDKAIEDYINQTLLTTTNIIVRDGEDSEDGKRMILPFYKVRNLTEISKCKLSDSVFTALNTSDYKLLDYGTYAYAYLLTGNFEKETQYKFTYQSGYDEIPKTVEQFATELVAEKVKESYSSNIGDSRLGMQNQSENIQGSNFNKSYKSVWDAKIGVLDQYIWYSI